MHGGSGILEPGNTLGRLHPNPCAASILSLPHLTTLLYADIMYTPLRNVSTAFYAHISTSYRFRHDLVVKKKTQTTHVEAKVVQSRFSPYEARPAVKAKYIDDATAASTFYEDTPRCEDGICSY